MNMIVLYKTSFCLFKTNLIQFAFDLEGVVFDSRELMHFVFLNCLLSERWMEGRSLFRRRNVQCLNRHGRSLQIHWDISLKSVR